MGDLLMCPYLIRATLLLGTGLPPSVSTCLQLSRVTNSKNEALSDTPMLLALDGVSGERTSVY
jgi:hypothetical protein